MKKRKPPAPPQTDFKNNPFRSLKGLAPATAAAAKTSSPPQSRKKTESDTEDDTSLFLRATEGAKKFDGDDPDAPAALPGRVPEKTVVRAPEDSRLFLSAMQKIGTTFRDSVPDRDLEEVERRSPTSRMRQLKRGTIHISEKLDLHGFLKDEALARLAQFVAAACSRGQQAVLVITGKGINSPEGPVLQGAVAEWLRTRGKGLVAEFSPAPRELGGSGAFVVFMKTR